MDAIGSGRSNFITALCWHCLWTRYHPFLCRWSVNRRIFVCPLLQLKFGAGTEIKPETSAAVTLITSNIFFYVSDPALDLLC